jgi:Zn-dependent protease
MQREVFEPSPPEGGGGPRAKSKSGTAAGIAAIGATILAKGKFALAALKFLPAGKFLLTAGSIAISILAYAAGQGLAFAVGFVLLILIHELGHGAAMKAYGIASGWPVFIPFFGAMIAMKGRPEHPRIEAAIAFAGPLAGAGASLMCAALGLLFHSSFLLALAYTGFFLNLFNLVPFGFLDGGRIARILSRRAWIIGAILLVLLFLKSPSPALVFIGAFGAMNAFKRQNDPDLELVTAQDRKVWAIRYFGLCAFLALGAMFSHQLLTPHLG